MTPKLTHKLRRALRATALVAAIGSVAFADTSLRLGATFPGWDKLSSSGADGRVAEALIDLARGYARQLGRFCSLPEAFLRERSSSLLSALVFYEGYLPYGSREEVLLDSFDQRVSIVRLPLRREVLVVLVDVDDLGVAMVVCDI
ncbi:MAG TPA: hypothetical protein VFF10_03150 [Trueperaceae bacterium]|nr:hypothetical protein [Trueperaceae bacterium]